VDTQQVNEDFKLLFDHSFYLLEYPDVQDSMMNPFDHFMKHGREELRQPSPLFSPTWYLSQNPELNGLDPLSHFIKLGFKEGLDPNPLFSTHWYLKNYLDDEKSENPLLHYLREGQYRGCDPHPLFDTDWYQSEYSSDSEFHGDPLSDFIVNGNRLRRNPNPTFSTSFYLNSYSDVALSGMNAFEHYITSGFQEGRLFSKLATSTSVEMGALKSRIPNTGVRQLRRARTAVLIPVFNNWAFTKRCLDSILTSTDANFVDIWVINDASTDSTLLNLESYPSVRVITLDENQGFLKACNFGFSHVLKMDYEFVYLLNNDVEITDKAVLEVIAQADLNPKSALIGSRLIYPDGTLQEAGGIIWSDASGWNFGRGDDPDKLAYSYSRLVDYCSGAAILIRTSALESEDLFDVQFAPAYYEDADLCFRLSKRGNEIALCASSNVIHHEGKSHGTDVSTGVKAHQVSNQTTFRAKWERELKTHFAADPENVMRAAHRNFDYSQKGLIWIDDLPPDPDRSAGGLRAYSLLKMLLELNYQIVFVPTYGLTSDVKKLQKLGIAISTSVIDAKEYFDEIGISTSVAWISRVTSAVNVIGDVLRLNSDVKIIFDTVDLHFLRLSRSTDIKDISQAEIVKRQEISMAKLSNTTLVVSTHEALILEDLIPACNVQLMPIPYQISQTLPKYDETLGLVFVGGFKHPPNAEGLTWFLDEVWPLLDRAIHQAGISIIGSSPSSQLVKLNSPQIRILGAVEDITGILQASRLSVAPLLSGAGIKGKVLQAMSVGVPVVGTSVAFEGIVSEQLYEPRPANKANELAESIQELYLNEGKWRSSQNLGIDLIKENYSHGSLRDGLIRVLG
jgi:GT2 family glycosyltransferase